jgi:hypothetical protein
MPCYDGLRGLRSITAQQSALISASFHKNQAETPIKGRFWRVQDLDAILAPAPAPALCMAPKGWVRIALPFSSKVKTGV